MTKSEQVGCAHLELLKKQSERELHLQLSSRTQNKTPEPWPNDATHHVLWANSEPSHKRSTHQGANRRLGLVRAYHAWKHGA